MAVPSYIQKTLVMKPEVTQIFQDLEAWHDHCRSKVEFPGFLKRLDPELFREYQWE